MSDYMSQGTFDVIWEGLVTASEEEESPHQEVVLKNPMTGPTEPPKPTVREVSETEIRDFIGPDVDLEDFLTEWDPTAALLERTEQQIPKDNFLQLSMEEVRSKIVAEQNKNTMKKTLQDVAKFRRFLKSKGENSDIHLLTPESLDELLANFILSIRKIDGSEYEPTTIRNMVSSIDRHLKRHRYTVKIMQEGATNYFQLTRDALAAKQKSLKKMGKGNKPHAADPITDAEIDLLYERNILGMGSPKALINTLWINNCILLGLRGTTENYNMRSIILAVILFQQYCEVRANTALLIIDVQNCFLPGGSLAVTGGNDVIPIINNIRQKYVDKISLTVLSQDWHCENHISFASQHPNHTAFSTIYLTYDENGTLCRDSSCVVAYNISQTLWPDHCIMNTDGANFSTALHMEPTDIIIRKGYHCDVDSYSAFFDNGHFSHTELHIILQNHSIDTLVVTGLALDFCVYFTSKDGKFLNYTVYTVVDASRSVGKATEVTAIRDMMDKGINLITSDQLDKVFVTSSGPLNTGLACVLLTLFLNLCGKINFNML